MAYHSRRLESLARLLSVLQISQCGAYRTRNLYPIVSVVPANHHHHSLNSCASLTKTKKKKRVPHFDKHRYVKYIHFISLYTAETTEIISFSPVMHFHTTRKKFVLLKSYICFLSLPSSRLSLCSLSVPPTPISSIT